VDLPVALVKVALVRVDLAKAVQVPVNPATRRLVPPAPVAPANAASGE